VTKVRVTGSVDEAQIRAFNPSVVYAIKEIEDFSAELNAVTFTDSPILIHREVDVLARRHSDHAASETSEVSFSRQAECCRIQIVNPVIEIDRNAGHEIRSLPQDEDGFLPIDNHGRVIGLEHVYAAGDGTNFPVKQGGIACQQADAAAASIAAEAGVGNDPRPFEPVLRGVLVTERSARFLRDGEAVTASAMWWPPTKIAGEELMEVLQDVGTMRRPDAHGAAVDVRLPVHAL